MPADLPKEPSVYLIRKRGAWYGPNGCGYTGSAIQAGRYTLAEAEMYTHPNGKDGPRDGMTYTHEDELLDEDWKAFADLRARIEGLERELAEAKTLIARNMFFDFGSAEDGCDFVGGMDGAVSLIEAHRAREANGSAKHGPDFPPRDCTAWEDCRHDGVCHDANCSARKRGAHG